MEKTIRPFPCIGLGTDKIYGEQMTIAVSAALSNGYRLFDTARAYKNEHFLGEAIEKGLKEHELDRKDIYFETKILIPENNIEGNVRSDVDDSCKNLRTDYLDVVLIHYPKYNESPDDSPKNAEMRRETYATLLMLQEEGKIRHVGVSNYEIRHLEEILRSGMPLPVVNQIELHPHFVRAELMKYCKEEGITVQAFTSLARHNPELLGDPVVQGLATLHKTSVSTILLAWASSQDVVIIPKSSNPERIAANAHALQLILTEDEIVALSSLNRDQNYVGRCTGWKPHNPVTIALPSIAPPWLLSSDVPLTLSLSPCPLSQFPSLIVPNPTNFKILLDSNRLAKVVQKGKCPNGTTNSMFATVISHTDAVGALLMSSVETNNSRTRPIDVDGSVYFEVQKNNFVSFSFQLASIEQGLNLDMGLTHGSAEVGVSFFFIYFQIFVSFCMDYKGASLDKIVYPTGLKRFFDPTELVQLIDQYSCNQAALQFDLENNPPAMIVRVRSTSTSGGILVTADEHHYYGSRLHRSALSGEQIVLGVNDTVTLEFPPATDAIFTIFSGAVSVTVVLCAEEAEKDLGTYSKGNYTIDRNNLKSECNVTMERVALTWTGDEESALQIQRSEDEIKPKFMKWWMSTLILAVSCILTCLTCGCIWHMTRMRRTKRKFDENKRNYEMSAMSTMTNIPLDGPTLQHAEERMAERWI